MARAASPAQGNIVLRPRLFHALDRVASVAWVAGPAGCGKTTLLSTYLRSRRAAHGWYRLGRADADLGTFVDGLARLDPAHARRAPLVAGGGHQAPLVPVVRRLFATLLERAPAGWVLVLEDLHEVAADAPLLGLLPELLASVPARRRVVVTSREEPPADLARLRAGGRLAVLGWNELRLTTTEARALVRRRAPGRMDRAAADALVREADGWAAGLVLLVEARSGGARAPARLRVEDGRPGALFDYFGGEVLATMRPEDRDNLLSLSVAPTLTARMAAELTGDPGASRILDVLARRQCFVERRPGPEASYRLHPLFHRFLQERAAQTLTPAALAGLRRRAGRLLNERGESEEAIDLLLAAQAWDDLQDAVVAVAPRLVAAGRERTLLRWLEAVPPDVIGARPWLGYWIGASGATCGFPFVRAHLAHAVAGFREAGDVRGQALALADLLDSYVLEWGRFRDVDPWIDAADAFIARCLERGVAVEPRLLIAAFRVLFFRRPEHPRLPWLRDQLAELRDRGRTGSALGAALALSYYCSWTGRPQAALQLASGAQTLVRELNAPVLARQTADYMESLALLKLGDGAGCVRAGQRALDRAAATGLHVLDYRLHSLMVYGGLTLRDPALVARHLGRMREALDSVPLIDAGYYHFLAGLDAAGRGDPQAGDRHARTAMAMAEESGLTTLTALTAFLSAQLAQQRGDFAAAEAHLARVHAIAEAMRSESVLFMAALLEADLRFARDDEEGATALLRETLQRGRERELGYYPGWWPMVMARLCTRALERAIEVDYVRAFVRAHDLRPEHAPVDVPDWPWAVEVRALGPLEVRCDGHLVAGAGNRAQQRPLELLRALLALGGRHVPVAQLIDALWPEGETGRAAFDVTLMRLRRLLRAPEALVLEDGRISLNEHRCWVDAWLVERSLDRADGARRRQDDARLETSLTRALAVYRGPFLADAGEAWALAPRERLRRRLVQHLDAVARAAEARRAFDRALAWYLRGLDVDDLAEGFYQGAMRCYHALGRPAEAAALLQRCRGIVRGALGVEPSGETLALGSPSGSARVAARVRAV